MTKKTETVEVEVEQTAQIALAIRVLQEKVERVIGVPITSGTITITPEKITFQENTNVEI